MLQVVFDDTLIVPEAVRSLVGIDRFGSLVFRRKTRAETMRSLVEAAGWPPIVHLNQEEDTSGLIDRLREDADDKPYLFCPSFLVPTDANEGVITFLRQIQYAPGSLHIPAEASRERRGWSLMRASLLRKYLIKQREGDPVGFFEEHRGALTEIHGRLRLIDVRDERTLQNFLSGQLDARQFNSVQSDEFTVLKRSTDRAKLKREFDYYRLLPPRMQMFFVQPFEFEDDGTTASYRMERVSVPDMSMQWLHAAFQPAEFERFLQHLLAFINLRPQIRVNDQQASATRDQLYVEKVRTRLSLLKSLPVYAQLAPLLECAGANVDALFERYLRLYERVRRRFPPERLVIGHGDLCFSNILYSKTNQLLKLIDPRGASSEADLYTDPYYDVAKLSHSILGNYDFINQGKFDVQVDDSLALHLRIDTPPPAWAGSMFADKLDKAGFDVTLARVCEASLFISLLPLHVDRPRNVLAFAMNAAAILETISKAEGLRS